MKYLIAHSCLLRTEYKFNSPATEAAMAPKFDVIQLSLRSICSSKHIIHQADMGVVD